jgi:hypothetical protein
MTFDPEKYAGSSAAGGTGFDPEKYAVEAGGQEPERPGILSTMFNPYVHGLKKVSSNTWNQIANAIDWGTAGVTNPMSRLGGQVLAGNVRGIAQSVAPTDELQGVIPKVIAGGIEGAGEIAKMMMGGPANILPVAAGMGFMGAPSTEPEAAITGAASNALTVGALKGLQALPLLTRMATGAGTFGGLSAVQGGDTEETVAEAVIGALLAAPGGKGGPLREALSSEYRNPYAGMRPAEEILFDEYVRPETKLPETKMLPAPLDMTAGEYPGRMVELGRKPLDVIEPPTTKEPGHYRFSPGTVADWLSIKRKAQSGALLTQTEIGALNYYEARFDRKWRKIWGPQVKEVAAMLDTSEKSGVGPPPERQPAIPPPGPTPVGAPEGGSLRTMYEIANDILAEREQEKAPLGGTTEPGPVSSSRPLEPGGQPIPPVESPVERVLAKVREQYETETTYPKPGGQKPLGKKAESVAGTPDIPAEKARWYHGTRKEFDDFTIDNANADLGVYFTSDKKLAEFYTSEQVHGTSGRPRIVETTVSPKKVLDVRYGSHDPKSITTLLDRLISRARKVSESEDVPSSYAGQRAVDKFTQAKQEMISARNVGQWKAGESKIWDGSFDLAKAENGALGKSYKTFSSAPVREEMQALGYDAVRKVDDGADALVVLDPKIIKPQPKAVIPDVSRQEAQGRTEEVGKKTIYHGTDKAFDEFDLKKSADGTIWFSDNKEMIESGQVAASGKGRIVERRIDESKLKLGGWEEADKYSTDQLINMGYDGLKLVDEGETTYQIFHPEKLTPTAEVAPAPVEQGAAPASKVEAAPNVPIITDKMPRELQPLVDAMGNYKSVDDLYGDITHLIDNSKLNRGLTNLTGKSYGIGKTPMYEGVKAFWDFAHKTNKGLSSKQKATLDRAGVGGKYAKTAEVVSPPVEQGAGLTRIEQINNRMDELNELLRQAETPEQIKTYNSQYGNEWQRLSAELDSLNKRVAKQERIAEWKAKKQERIANTPVITSRYSNDWPFEYKESKYDKVVEVNAPDGNVYAMVKKKSWDKIYYSFDGGITSASTRKTAFEKSNPANRAIVTKSKGAPPASKVEAGPTVPEPGKVSPDLANQIYEQIGRNVFKDIVTPSIQNDGQRILTAITNIENGRRPLTDEIAALEKIEVKYRRDYGLLQGADGGGPGKVKRPRAGASVVYSSVRKLLNELGKGKSSGLSPSQIAKLDRAGVGGKEAKGKALGPVETGGPGEVPLYISLQHERFAKLGYGPKDVIGKTPEEIGVLLRNGRTNPNYEIKVGDHVVRKTDGIGGIVRVVGQGQKSGRPKLQVEWHEPVYQFGTDKIIGKRVKNSVLQTSSVRLGTPKGILEEWQSVLSESKEIGPKPKSPGTSTVAFMGMNPDVAKDVFKSASSYIWQGFPKETTPIKRPIKGPDIGIVLNDAGKVDILGDISQVKDIGPSTAYTRDNFRNVRQAFGEKADDVIVKPLLEAKDNTINFQGQQLAEQHRVIEKGLNIKPHTPEDRAVMAVGEGRMTPEEAVKKFGQARADQIIAAEKWYRQTYDMFLDQANAVMEQVYPGRIDKQITKRKDYFRHYKELGGMRDIIANFENPADVPAGMGRVGDFMKPKSRTLGFMRQRLGSKSGESAAAGFANYVQGVSYAIHINPMVARLRSFADALTKATGPKAPTPAEMLELKKGVAKELGVNLIDRNGQMMFPKGSGVEGHIRLKVAVRDWQRQPGRLGSRNLDRTILAMNRWADNLAGMINPIDKPFIELGGERAMSFANSLAGRMRSNAILGNVSALIGQAGNIPNAIGLAGPRNSILGLQDAVASIFLENRAIKQSAFLKERYSNLGFDKFELSWVGEKTGLYTRPYAKQTAVWLMNTVNKCADYFTWNAMYRKAVNDRVANPIKAADAWTREVVAGRGIGEIPIVMQSKALRLIAPFQIEVGNAVWVLRDMVGDKRAGALITFAVASYVFNEFARHIRGSQVSFDPINAVKDAVTMAADPNIPTEKKLYQVPGRIAGEAFSNLPFGQSLASNIMSDDARKKFFGSQDPSRFGTGAFITQGIQKPLTTVLLPFGGKQVEKTIGGIQAVQQGQVKSKAGKTLFKTGETVESQIRNIVFGKWSTPEAREYFDNGPGGFKDYLWREYHKGNKVPLKEAYSAGKLTEREVREIVSDKTAAQRKMRHMPLDQAMQFYDDQSPEEQKGLRQMMAVKIRNWAESASPEDKKKMLATVKAFYARMKTGAKNEQRVGP